MTVFVLLPAFNEEAAVESLVPKTCGALQESPFDLRIVIVNDGSTDRTAQRVAALSKSHLIDVLTHPTNLGLGQTIRDGIEHCVRRGGPGDAIVRMDCDDTQDPGRIPALLDALRAGADVAIASRFQPGGGEAGVRGLQKLLSHAAGLFMKVVFPIRGVRDYSSGYRAYRWETLRDAQDVFDGCFIEQAHLGFSCTLEKIVKLRMIGARFVEVPHVLRYDLKTSPSKMARWPTMRGYLTLVWKYSPWCGVRRLHWRSRIKALRAARQTGRPSGGEVDKCAASPAV